MKNILKLILLLLLFWSLGSFADTLPATPITPDAQFSEAISEQANTDSLVVQSQPDFMNTSAPPVGSAPMLAASTENASQADFMYKIGLRLSTMLLVFGLVVMAMIGFLIYRGGNANEILKLFGTVLVIVAAVFLIVAGYSDQQIAPAMGLLGTIAGYLLGSPSGQATVKPESSPKPDDRVVTFKEK